MEIIVTLLSVIISIIILILFIEMSSNVRRIRKAVEEINESDRNISLSQQIRDKQPTELKLPKKEIEPWVCKHCKRENTLNETICEKCGFDKN